MKSKIKGFTLGEVLVCIVIIGVIMALAMQSIKIVKTSYTSLTYYVYNNLQAIVGDLYAGEDPNNNKYKDTKGNIIDSAVSYCREVNETIVNGQQVMEGNGALTMILKPDRPPKGILPCNKLDSHSESPSYVFCNASAYIMNTVGKVDCLNYNPVLFNSEKKEPYMHINNYDNPNFITTNGMRYYLSEWNFDETVSKKFGFRLISVDLNGKSKPNLSEVQTNNTVPDIVSFMILDNGEVIPLGVAADNINLTSNNRIIRYLNSKVKGYYYLYPQKEDEREKRKASNTIPQECFIKTKKGNIESCNYSVIYVQKENAKASPEEEEEKDTDTDEDKDKEKEKNSSSNTFFSFREAYCAVIDKNTNVLTNYCNNIAHHSLCPPSSEKNGFDLCLVDNIKPMFRYNLK